MPTDGIGIGFVPEPAPRSDPASTVTASASIALSTANVPIDSPGARMKVLAMRWTVVTCWPMR